MNDEFLQELKILLEKYQVKILSSDNYDGSEEYCGSDHYFYGRDGEINIMIEEGLTDD